MKVVKKPWGQERIFAFNEKSSVKIIEVMSHQALSLQKHKKRKERWYFLKKGIVRIGGKTKSVKEGESVFIGKNVAHRLIAGKNKVLVLEISFGEFDEKDIVRLEDKYGRK